MAALRAALDALKQGKILGISPEGTRQTHRSMTAGVQRGSAAGPEKRFAAADSCHWSGENFLSNLKHLQLAKLLSEYYRGKYADLEKATEKYIRWL